MNRRVTVRQSGASVAGLAASQVVAKTTTYTAVNHDLVLASASGGAFTVTLPAVAAGAFVTVKKTDSSANVVTVSPASGTIDGASSVALSVQYESYDFVSDGTNWFIV